MGKLKQQTEAHVPGTGPLVLDELYLTSTLASAQLPDCDRLEEATDQAGVAELQSQQKEVANQYEQMYKLSVHLRKRS